MRFRGEYPPEWPEMATAVKDEADWRCVRCGHPHAPRIGRTLTVHHLDADKANCRWWNIPALCQACHLTIQGDGPRYRMMGNAVTVPVIEWIGKRLLAREAAA